MEKISIACSTFSWQFIQVDSKNRIWLSIGRAKYLFDPKTEKFRYLIGFDWSHRNSDILCGSVKEDASGQLWMATWAHGFYIWNESKQEFEKKETAPESLTAFEFDKDEQGKPFMWCGGGAYGLMAYDTSEKNSFTLRMTPGINTHIISAKPDIYFVIQVQELYG
jgi:hypothetical protein